MYILDLRVFLCGFMALAILMLLPSVGHSVNPDEILKDPALEKRARKISAQLRCLVCQNQSIDDSDAPLARDLRVLVRERLVAGDTDKQVLDFVVQRYGEFSLLKPRFNFQTLLLWLSPVFLLIIAGLIIGFSMRGRSDSFEDQPAELTEQEKQDLEKLLQKEY